MFEGQNIHLSPVDGKRLCSFSQKICKQHRLNNFAFCIRHILEDKNAPFKQCQYKTKANGERCFNPVPEAADRIYCSSHLQVLGMIPKNPSKLCQEKKKTGSLKNKNKKDNSGGNKKIASSDKDLSKKINRNARKILEEDYTEVKTNWYAVMTKVFKKTAYNLQMWQKQGFDTEVSAFLKSRRYQKHNQEFFRTHVMDDSDDEHFDDDASLDVFQSIYLDSNERVHHNSLRIESPVIQGEDMLLKVKHRNGQLKEVIGSNIKKKGLSYSVLSKLIVSARKNTVQTANVLNVESGASSYGSFRLHRECDEAVSYQVPCALLSSDVHCKKLALPYTRYCCDHISRDTDQYLFSNGPSVDVTNPMQSLPFLHGGEMSPSLSSSSSFSSTVTTSTWNQNKRKVDTPTTQSKFSNQRLKPNVEEKRLKKKKRKTKKKPIKPTASSTREDKIDIHPQPIQKRNAHLKKTPVEMQPKALVKNEEELHSNSNSEEEEDDADILTPEEAFHLPPGSLSFSPRMVDDDSIPTIENRNCALDDEDDELISCSNNFTFDSNSNLPRDIGSPTLNQLSSSDFASSFSNIFSSPAKTLDSAPPIINPNKTTFHQTFNAPVCRPNNPTVNNRLAHSNQPAAAIINEQKSGTTILKISHVDMFRKTTGKIDHNAMYTPKPIQEEGNTSGNSIGNDVPQYRNNGLSSVNSQQLLMENESINSYSHLPNALVNRAHNISMKESISYDQTSLSKRYLSDSLLLQQPLSQDNTLFDDINTDVESPLEKVNPDIFFSSVFPVSTSTESM